jgi:acetyltransferase
LPIRFLRQHGYGGKIFPVNPKYKAIAGLPCFPALKDIPEPVDLALIGIPRQLVFEAIKGCVAKKVPFVILFSAGYAEMGEEGRKEQEELRKFVRQVGVRVVGPNCIGIINTHDHVASSFTSGLEIESLIPGAVGLITQSGGIGNCILTRAHDRSTGLSFFISSGNELDLEVSDFVEHFVQDKRTRSIALLLEDLKDPKKFSRAADEALQANKPIVALKVGRSEKGREAAASHTGAMSGADAIYDGFFRQKGVIRVFDIDELLEVANLLARYVAPAGSLHPPK